MNESFVEMTKRVFAFLENAGFRLRRSGPDDLQYESDRSFVVVRWEGRSGEIDASVGMLPRTGRAQDEYSIADVMGLDGVPDAERNPSQVADETRLGPFLEKLATALRTHGQPALAGDPSYFERLETYRSAKAGANLRAMQLRQVRAAAEKAWHEGDFERVASLYGPVESELSESEAHKLKYARQRRRGATHGA